MNAERKTIITTIATLNAAREDAEANLEDIRRMIADLKLAEERAMQRVNKAYRRLNEYKKSVGEE